MRQIQFELTRPRALLSREAAGATQHSCIETSGEGPPWAWAAYGTDENGRSEVSR